MASFAMSSPQLRKKARSYFEQEELPDEMAWIDRLTPLHQRLFTIDLKAALDRASKDNGAMLREVIESWEATASVDADSVLRSTLRAKRDRKRYSAWAPASKSRSR